jgi:hypothetical protein
MRGPSSSFRSLVVFDHPRHSIVVSSVLGHEFSKICDQMSKRFDTVAVFAYTKEIRILDNAS